MRLLIASDCFLPRWDGVTRFLLEVIPRLDDYQITVLAPNFGEYKEPDYFELVRFPLLNIAFGDIYFSRVDRRVVKKHVQDADIIFSQTIGPIGMAVINEAHKQRKPVVAYIHSIEWELATRSMKRFKSLVNSTVRKLARIFYNKCSLLLIPYEEAEEKLRKNGVKTDMMIVRLGMDSGKFIPPKDKNEAKRNIGIPEECKVIGFCGRIGREKDLMTLYRAFRKIEKQHPEARLLVVGKGVKELEKEFTSNRNIIMVGSKDNVVPYLQAMDIYVLPSLTETTSLSTLEAMSCGVAVVCTPVGYVKNYIKERENGMLFPFHNSLVLSLKLDMLLKDSTLREKLGKNARATVEMDFSWEKTLAGIKSALKRAASSK